MVLQVMRMTTGNTNNRIYAFHDGVDANSFCYGYE